jgi:hypothetical protein
MRFLTDSAKLYAALAFAVSMATTAGLLMFGNWSLEKDVKRLDGEVRTAQADLATCKAERGQFEQDVKTQSDAVDQWKAEADRVRQAGELATRQAQARARSLEVQLLGARRATVQPGETVCEAADRLILERVG